MNNPVTMDRPGETVLLMGNEAIVRVSGRFSQQRVKSSADRGPYHGAGSGWATHGCMSGASARRLLSYPLSYLK